MEKRSHSEEESALPRPPKRGHIKTTSEENGRRAVVTKISILVFGRRPTVLQSRAIDFIINIKQDSTSVPQEFATHIRSYSQTASMSAIASLWRTIREWFDDENKVDLANIHDLIDIPALVTNLKSMPSDIADLIVATDDSVPITSTSLLPELSSSSSLSSSTPSSQSRTPPSVTSTGTLKSIVVNKMREEFKRNFQAYKGALWTLPSMAVIDNLLATYVDTLRKESPLHSFVIDDVNVLLSQITDDADREAITNIMVTRPEETSPMLSAEEAAYIGLFNKKPIELEKFLSNGRSNAKPVSENMDDECTQRVWFAVEQIYFIYWGFRFELPVVQSESWYIFKLWGFLSSLLECHGTLVYQPGEICSAASSLRKNKGRVLGARQLMGRKVDGLVRCVTAGLEICVIEAARSNNGPTETKALCDTRKLAKSMKDIYDAIRGECLINVRDKLVTFGIRISAISLSFYTLRQRPGRFYQLSLEETVSFPPAWDMSGGNTPRILNVVSSVLRFKKQIIEMAQNIQTWTTPAFDAPNRQPVDDEWAATLTTPMNSPPLSPTSL
ncbi:hypothetical protein FBU30_000226 [Linnemannia zychae]|nr:hypothetical protein FBU30_000226 [Linnemannia zychae]